MLELIGAVIKPFALCVRLFANMVAGHILLAVLIGLIMAVPALALRLTVGVPIALLHLGIQLLEIFVAFLQAYIFTFLTTLFLASAVRPNTEPRQGSRLLAFQTPSSAFINLRCQGPISDSGGGPKGNRPQETFHAFFTRGPTGRSVCLGQGPCDCRRGIGMGIAVLGGGRGIGQIGGQAVEGIARQPEAGGRIGTNMIIAAALIEGFTFTAIILSFVLAFAQVNLLLSPGEILGEGF